MVDAASNLVPVALRQVQELLALRARRAVAPRRAGLRPVRLGADIRAQLGPTAVRVLADDRRSCAGAVELLTRNPLECRQRQTCDPALREAVASGVAEGLRRAPLNEVSPASWAGLHSFRNRAYPQTANVVLTTFASTHVVTVQAQRAFAGYLGSVAYPTAVVATTGTPASVLAFRAPDAYTGDELVIATQDQESLYLVQWTVTVNGNIATGPFSVVGGRARLNVQCRRDDAVSLNAILLSGDSFALPLVVQLDGWMQIATRQTDGTYDRTLRMSPNWPKEEGCPW